MGSALFYLDPDSELTLQAQIRQKLVGGIVSGVFPAGTRLPSSRKLAEQLDVSRNTVVAAYQELTADGYIESRHRSGIFVSDRVPESPPAAPGRVECDMTERLLVWRSRIKHPRISGSEAHDLPNWRSYPFAFIDGKFDSSLFPLAEWREANKLALTAGAVEEWSAADGDADDPMLVREVRTKLLTRRGIQAGPDEVLVTLGNQSSLYLISRLLADQSVHVAIEDPGNFRMRGLLDDLGANLLPQPVDEDGLIVRDEIGRCDWAYVTPSHQIPTAVAMPMKRRRELLEAANRYDFLIVEDDYECELSYQDHPEPALRSMDSEDRVIYVAELAKVLAPGVRLGVIVANAAFVRRARELRESLFSHPPQYSQRVAAYFLSLGYYDAMMMRLGVTLRRRRLELRDALSNMRGVPLRISPEVGGTTYWVKAPRQFNVDFFVQQAAEQGILLEPVRHYYLDTTRAENCFRMGVTSIPQKDVVPGVKRLVDLIRFLVRGQVEQLDNATGTWLRRDQLRLAMSGATIYYEEVYGALCTIRLHPDGTMTGAMDSDNEDVDSGTWRIEGDRFCRQWNRWNYATEASYYIVKDGNQIKYFNADRQIVDSARIDTATGSG